MKPIYSYKNYRLFLRDHYLFHKPSGLTYESFAKSSGMRARNILKLVIDGKKNLSIDSLHSFGKALRLNYEETQYFEALVLHEQADSPATRSYYQTRLSELRAKRPESQAIVDAKELLEQWFYPAILLAISGSHERDACARACRLTGLAEKQVRQTIEALVKSGLLSVEGGVYRLRENNLSLQDRKKISETHRNFLRSQLKLSEQALEQTYAKRGKFRSQTFTASRDSYMMYVSRIDSLLDEILGLSDEDSSEEVIQVNVQIFPLNEFK